MHLIISFPTLPAKIVLMHQGLGIFCRCYCVYACVCMCSGKEELTAMPITMRLNYKSNQINQIMGHLATPSKLSS